MSKLSIVLIAVVLTLVLLLTGCSTQKKFVDVPINCEVTTTVVQDGMIGQVITVRPCGSVRVNFD